MNKDTLLYNLYNKQLENIDNRYKLSYKDMIRLSFYINGDPFSETECCKWNGAISLSTHNSKYINFWFKRKKYSLHRILYMNYRGNLPKNKYLRFTCNDYNMKGVCCNINHINIINNENIRNIINIDSVNNNKDHDIFIIVFNE